jgi:hypothetical protein
MISAVAGDFSYWHLANVGVEIGHPAIVLVAVASLVLLRKRSMPAWHYTRLGLAWVISPWRPFGTAQRVLSAVKVV